MSGGIFGAGIGTRKKSDERTRLIQTLRSDAAAAMRFFRELKYCF
jgi:hypothetical protein